MWGRVVDSPPPVGPSENLDLMYFFLGHFLDFICNLIIQFWTIFLSKNGKNENRPDNFVEKKILFPHRKFFFQLFFPSKMSFWDHHQVCGNDCFWFQKIGKIWKNSKRNFTMQKLDFFLRCSQFFVIRPLNLYEFFL